MVSMSHECLVDLFKNRPSLAAEMLVEALHISLPAYDEARIASVELNETRPAEYRADLVILLLDDARPVRVVIVEVQLGRDDDKRYTWPAYLSVSRDRHRCQASLLVIAPDLAVARWCREPIDMGVPGFTLTPPVLRKDEVPILIDPAEAARRPELGVLSAMAYGDTDHGATIASAVLPAIHDLEDERARFYYDLVYNSLNEAARRALEAKMKGYEYQSDFAKKYVAQGRDEERLESVARAARAVLTVLRARGIAVSDAARERIMAEKDVTRLERWHEKAIVVATLAEVFGDPS